MRVSLFSKICFGISEDLANVDEFYMIFKKVGIILLDVPQIFGKIFLMSYSGYNWFSRLMAHHTLANVFGVLGNIASCISFAALIPTFAQIVRGGSVLEYRLVPYITSLLCQLIWLYYGCLLQRLGIFIIVVSAVGCFVQTAYICIYLRFATAELRRHAVMLVIIVLGLFSLIVVFTFFVIRSVTIREVIVGWCCVIITVASFAAPLTTVWQVIRTKTTQFMPFALSSSLTVNATMWLAFGLATHDVFIMIPNVLGIVLGVTQMLIYVYYRFLYSGVQRFSFIWDIASFRL